MCYHEEIEKINNIQVVFYRTIENSLHGVSIKQLDYELKISIVYRNQEWIIYCFNINLPVVQNVILIHRHLKTKRISQHFVNRCTKHEILLWIKDAISSLINLVSTRWVKSESSSQKRWKNWKDFHVNAAPAKKPVRELNYLQSSSYNMWHNTRGSRR